MKKNLFIIIGAIVVVGLLIAAWVYVMFFGTPRELPTIPESFNFDFGSNDVSTIPIEQPTTFSTSTPQLPITGQKLRQLTTRPVIGYQEVVPSGTNTSPILLYAEAGTGHVYSIDLVTGVEVRKSGTTILEAAEAVFSQDGRYVVYRSGYNRVGVTIIGTLNAAEESLFTTELGELGENMHIAGNETLFYTVRNSSTVAKSRNLRTGSSNTLFTVPFSNPTVLWGNGEKADHFVLPKPSHLLPGYVYRVSGLGSLTRLPVSGFGLSAFRSGPFVTISTVDTTEGRYNTAIVDTKDLSIVYNLGSYIPEKCAASVVSTERFWCVTSPDQVSFGFPDTWHRGETVLADTITEIMMLSTSTITTTIVDTEADSGRTIDGFNYRAGPGDERLYFVNRIDNTLWSYDLGD